MSELSKQCGNGRTHRVIVIDDQNSRQKADPIGGVRVSTIACCSDLNHGLWLRSAVMNDGVAL